MDMGALPSPAEVVRERVDQVLVGQGFFEIFTDGFYARATRERLGLTEGHPLWDHVETLNALDRGYTLLKNNTLAQAVEAVATNLRVRHDEIKAFEWTRTFHPDPTAANGVCRERPVLWAIASGHAGTPDWTGSARVADTWFLKGVVGEIAQEIGLDLRVGEPDAAHPLHDLLHPGRQAAILLDGRVVGILGEVHPSICRAHKVKRERPVYLEIDALALLAPGHRPAYIEPSETHPILRNLAFTLPMGVTAGEVARTLQDQGPTWLVRVDMVDLFEHEDEGRPVRTVTFALVYEAGEAQRTAEEVNTASEALIRAIADRLGNRGVKLRA